MREGISYQDEEYGLRDQGKGQNVNKNISRT
jgi:hypothetical protein